MTIRQFKLMRWFLHHTANIEEALTLNQRTFGSCCARHWLAFNAQRRVFYATEEGIDLCQNLMNWNWHRGNNNGKFSTFVELPKKNNLYQVRKSA